MTKIRSKKGIFEAKWADLLFWIALLIILIGLSVKFGRGIMIQIAKLFSRVFGIFGG